MFFLKRKRIYCVHTYVVSFELHIIGSMSLLLTTMYTLIPPYL